MRDEGVVLESGQDSRSWIFLLSGFFLGTFCVGWRDVYANGRNGGDDGRGVCVVVGFFFSISPNCSSGGKGKGRDIRQGIASECSAASLCRPLFLGGGSLRSAALT